MASELEIEKAGIAAVVRWLEQKGYTANVEPWPGELTLIVAEGPVRKLVVLARASMPGIPARAISMDDRQRIKSRAVMEGADACEARVLLGDALESMEHIRWIRF